MEEGGGGLPAPRQRWAVLLVCGALAVAAYAWPLPGIPETGRRMTAILVVVVTLWISEALPIAVTALLGPALAVLVGAAPATKAFAAFGNPIIMLFVGSFLLARVTFKHRLNERIAYRVLSLPAVGNDPTRAFIFLGLTTAALSAWMSNVAVTAMMLPIAQSVLLAMSGDRRHAAARAWRGLRPDRHLCRLGRRPLHAGRHAAEPDRHRPDRSRRPVIASASPNGSSRSSPSSSSCCWR